MNDYKTRVKNLREMVRLARTRGEEVPELIAECARKGRAFTLKPTKADLELARELVQARAAKA